MREFIQVTKSCDWSINLEEDYDPNHPEALIEESVEAVQQTASSFYVNIITPGEAGHPEDGFIPQLTDELNRLGIQIERIVYIDECGCGGHVTRVYR